MTASLRRTRKAVISVCLATAVQGRKQDIARRLHTLSDATLLVVRCVTQRLRERSFPHRNETLSPLGDAIEFTRTVPNS